MKSDPEQEQEDEMSSKSKSATVRGAARTHAAKPPGRPARRTATAPEVWEQAAQATGERDDAIDCQRIVQGNDSRSPALYYDDFN